MIESGMTAMMKALGLDPAELKTHVEAFTSHMKLQAELINANQRRLEEKLDELLNRTAAQPVPATTEILDAEGKGTSVLVTSERFPQAMIDDVNSTGTANSYQYSASEERSAGEA